MKYYVSFGSTFENVEKHSLEIKRLLEKELVGVCESCLVIIDFVIRELLNNAVEHGNGLKPEKMVKCTIDADEKEFKIKVCDEGEGFDLEKIKSEIEATDKYRERNRGILVMEDCGFEVETKLGYIMATIQIEKFNIKKG